MRFVAKKLLVVRNRDWGDLIDPLGSEAVKCSKGGVKI